MDVKTFSQDVSALSHELGEWMDDPFVDNVVGCQRRQHPGSGRSARSLGELRSLPIKLNGFADDLQSLVFIGYVSAPRSDSADESPENVKLTSVPDSSFFCCVKKPVRKKADFLLTTGVELTLSGTPRPMRNQVTDIAMQESGKSSESPSGTA